MHSRSYYCLSKTKETRKIIYHVIINKRTTVLYEPCNRVCYVFGWSMRNRPTKVCKPGPELPIKIIKAVVRPSVVTYSRKWVKLERKDRKKKKERSNSNFVTCCSVFLFLSFLFQKTGKYFRKQVKESMFYSKVTGVDETKKERRKGSRRKLVCQ